MPVAILILVIAAYVYALAVLPQYRLAGLIAGALAAAALGWYLFLTPSVREIESNRISRDELRLDLLLLEDTARGATLSGRVENLAPAARLREMTLTLSLHDCPPEAPNPAACPVIAEAEALSRVDVPPGQIRGFEAHFVFPNRPPITGVLRWDHRITALLATD